jgi:hypothetical protein
LPLQIGDSADISVALIDVETLDVKAVRRRYRRLDERRWAVTDLGDGTEAREFDVDEHGLVIDEPGRFRRVS